MTNWFPNIESKKGPRYLAIADAIGEGINDGSLKAGERLPTHRDLAYRLGVTVGTVSRAYAEADRRDYVTGEVGRGTYVKGEEEKGNPFHIPYDRDPDIYDFSLNFPAEGETVERLRHALAEISRDPGLGALMRYQSERGMEHHRLAMAKWAEHQGAPFDPERIVVSCGVQHAMTLSLMTLCRAGDHLLCEEYSYPGIKTLSAQLGLKMNGLPMDQYGIIPEKFEAAVISTGARVLYCMPRYQNPTTVSMSLERKQQIVDIAKRHGVWLIEDDIYGFLDENPKANPTLAALLPEQTFYLNGASKCIGPGLRVGFVLAPESKATEVAACMRLSNWMAAPINVELVHRWVEDGTVFKFMKWHQEEGARRQQAMFKNLGHSGILSQKNSYHAWFTLPSPWQAETYCMRARERDVSILPAHVFQTSKRESANAVRICFGASPNQEHVEEGMKRLGRLLSEEIHAFHSVM